MKEYVFFRKIPSGKSIFKNCTFFIEIGIEPVLDRMTFFA